MNENLSLHNVGSMPETFTWSRGRRKSIIDLTLTANGCDELIHDWKVSNRNIIFSDHSMITMTIDVEIVRNIISK